MRPRLIIRRGGAVLTEPNTTSRPSFDSAIVSWSSHCQLCSPKSTLSRVLTPR